MYHSASSCAWISRMDLIPAFIYEQSSVQHEPTGRSSPSKRQVVMAVIDTLMSSTFSNLLVLLASHLLLDIFLMVPLRPIPLCQLPRLLR